MMEEKTVLFVTSQPQVSTFLYNLFNKEELKNSFFVEGTASTRESAISIATEKRPDLIIFFEKTAGIIPISSLIYKLRLTGARVLYISSKRGAGDLILETIVGYGVYDIILNDEITDVEIINYILTPREFRDVALFHREVDIPDNATGKYKNFKIPDLDYLRSFTDKIDNDYLADPVEKIVNKIPPKINREADEKTIKTGLFKRKKKEKENNNKSKQKVKSTNKKDGLGDLPDFD